MSTHPEPATLEEALIALREAREEAARWLAFIERGMDNHMQFGVINEDGTTEQLPCADWCQRCKINRAEGKLAEARRMHDQTCPFAQGELTKGFMCSMCEVLAEEADPKIVWAPWTTEQVEALNRYQTAGKMHPFTCPEHVSGSPSLVARREGWRCSKPYGEDCGYRQYWAHRFMLDPAASGGGLFEQVKRADEMP